LEVPKKFLKNPKNFLSTSFYSNRVDRDKGLIAFPLPKLNRTIGEGKQRIVLAYTNVLTRMILRTTLTNENIAGNRGLPAIDLNS